MSGTVIARGDSWIFGPEASYEKGGDVGNVGEVARMHEGSDPYWRTPRVGNLGALPLDSARQADRLSR